MKNYSLAELYELSKNSSPHQYSFDLTITEELNAHLVSIYPEEDASPLVRDLAFAKSKGFPALICPILPFIVYVLPTIEKNLLGTNLIGIGTTGTNFRKPIFVGDTVTITGTLVSVSRATRIVTFNANIMKASEIIADGQWRMQVLSEL
jgi:hypothetical protein